MYSDARVAFYGIQAYPNSHIDGFFQPIWGSYQAYLAAYEERMEIPTNYSVVINMEGDGINFWGNENVGWFNANNDNKVLHLVLTESYIPESWYGGEELNHVARLMIPDQFGTSLSGGKSPDAIFDFEFSLEEGWIKDSCELVAFVQDTVTMEIYQGASLMMADVVMTFPPPANLTYSLAGSDVVLGWDEPESEGLTGYNVYHAYDGGDFELVAFVQETTFTHVNPEWGLHEYYVTAQYLTDESEPTETVVVLLTGIEEDLSHAVAVYPNPAIDKLCVRAPSGIQQVDLYGLTGQLVYSIETNASILNLNVAELETGLYIMRLQTKEGTAAKSVVIE